MVPLVMSPKLAVRCWRADEAERLPIQKYRNTVLKTALVDCSRSSSQYRYQRVLAQHSDK
ncbi:hypothetical protein D3C76_1177730 [compost metagenome]